ncbi:type III restriction endonuclease subunit R, partial [Candidatus Aerophobetes bacterium]|nr:type III restriction endonuclease subunit R [Candidatus Aerophobetes bacterium]
AKLKEKPSSRFVERYEDYIHLGYVEWKKQYDELKDEKTPLSFFMTTQTEESDQLAAYLENRYPEFKKATLVIHTNQSGEVVEKVSKKSQDELETLRKAADKVDEDESPYRAIVSVLMLREGWDVRNVTTIVGLRPYKAASNILPEQTLGRGIRKMFGPDVENEELAVIGTPAFIEFVESIKEEGVELGYRKMGEGVKTKTPIIVEPDKENKSKDLDKLDIHIPVLTPRIYREYKRLEDIDVNKFAFKPIVVKEFSEEETREIIFEDLDRAFSHTITLGSIDIDYRSVISFFTNSILNESRLFSGFDALYPKVEEFITYRLFGKEVDLQEPNILRILSEMEAKKTVFTIFKKAIDELTITDKGSAEVRNYIKLKEVKPMVFDNQEFVTPKKS